MGRDPARRIGHMHDPGGRVLRAERAVPKPEVKRRAYHDDQVSGAQCHRPGARRQQVMPAGQHPAGLPVGDNRQLQFLGRQPRRVLRATEPDV